MTLRIFVERLLAFLRVQEPIGGLEIADTTLRCAAQVNGTWRTASLRLPPGIIEGGKIQDRVQFVEALKTLRDQIAAETGTRGKVSVVVSLSSAGVYSQVFTLPTIAGDGLEKAIQLNLQMISPAAASEVYSGWQVVNEDEKESRLEVLSSFINRALVDELLQALAEGGYIVYALESRAMALTRLVRGLGEGVDREGSYLVLSLDVSGLELLVMRRSQLYFNYFTPWSDLRGKEQEISWPTFEAALTRNLQQVLNFYRSHWPDAVRELLIVASGLEEAVERTLMSRFSLATRVLRLIPGTSQAGSEWFIALGSGLRGIVPRGEDREVNLLGIPAQEEFHRSRVMKFFHFWSVAVPVSLSILLAALLAADLFLVSTVKTLRLASQTIVGDIKEITALEKEVGDFNRAVAFIGKIQGTAGAAFDTLGALSSFAAVNGVTLNRISFPGIGLPASVSGEAASEGGILGFKKALDGDPRFQSVTLPLSDIRPTPAGLSFSMSFITVAPKTP